MKKLFRIHFIAIAVIDLLLFAFFNKRPETSLEWLLLSGFIFLLTQGLLLFRLVVRLKHLGSHHYILPKTIHKSLKHILLHPVCNGAIVHFTKENNVSARQTIYHRIIRSGLSIMIKQSVGLRLLGIYSASK